MPRIIRGKNKNKRLLVADKVTRPLTDRIKTSIFDIIQEHIKDSVILDGYAGSGSFGLEAISRDAAKSFFVESNSTAMELLSQNIQNTNSEDQSDLFYGPLSAFSKENTQSFNIIFLDPPFPYGKKLEDLLSVIPFLASDGIIIIRTPKDEAIDLSNQKVKNISKVYEKIYGESRVAFLRN